MPAFTWVSGTELGEVSCASSLESAMLVLPTFQSTTQQYLKRLRQSDPYFMWGLMLWDQHSIWNPNIGLLCWIGNIGLKELALLLQSRGSSGSQIGPILGRGPGLESMGNLWEEFSALIQEDTPQTFRPRYMLSWTVFMKFNYRKVIEIREYLLW